MISALNSSVSAPYWAAESDLMNTYSVPAPSSKSFCKNLLESLASIWACQRWTEIRNPQTQRHFRHPLAALNTAANSDHATIYQQVDFVFSVLSASGPTGGTSTGPNPAFSTRINPEKELVK